MAPGRHHYTQLPESLKAAIRHRRVLPIVGPGIPDFVQHAPSLSSTDSRPKKREMLRRWFEANGERVLPLYDTVAEMPCSCVIALTPDRHFAEILSASDQRWLPLETEDEAIDDQRSLLIQLAGTTNHPDTLLINDDDWLSIGVERPFLWDLARSYAARDPLLLLGCDPEDESVRDLVAELRPHRHFKPAGWVLCGTVNQAFRDRWAECGFDVVCAPAGQLLEQIRAIDAGEPSHEARTLRVADRPSPYMNLNYYEREDEPLFFGRKSETRRLINLVCAHRLVVVTGPSGSGKTSLLQAGLLAWCDRQYTFSGLYARCGQNPEKALIDALRRADGGTSESSRDPATYGTLIEELEVFASTRRSVPVIVLDQVEELFTRFDDYLRDRLLVGIRDCLITPHAPVRLVLSLRDDFFSRLVDLRARVPTLLQNSFYLPPLSREGAIEAICEPCVLFGVKFEPALAERILDEIGSGRVAPPQIQLVCDHLFRHRDGRDITQDYYERLGGTETILKEFLSDQIARLGPDGDLAKDVLKAMVTSEGTKEVLTALEVAARSERDLQDVSRILDLLLHRCRVIRPITENDERRFEVVHEYLTSTIWEWMTERERQRRALEETMVKQLRAWREFRTIRFGLDPLRRFFEQPAALKWDVEALTLLLLSSITHQQNALVWVRIVRELGTGAEDGVAARLFESFTDADLNQRCDAAEVIAHLEPAPLFRALVSSAAATRCAAIEMLGGLGLQSAVDPLIDALSDSDATCRTLACGALGAIKGEKATKALLDVLDSQDVPLAAAAMRALGRLGVPRSAVENVRARLGSTDAEIAGSARDAIAYGNSPELVKGLLESKPTAKEAKRLWAALAAMPPRCESWFARIVASLPHEQLAAAENIPHTNWVGWLAYKPAPIADERPNAQALVRTRDVAGIVSALLGVFRCEVIGALVNRPDLDLLERLARHETSFIRWAALEVLIQLHPSVLTPQQREWITRSALQDTTERVRSAACRAASQFQMWDVLQNVLAAERTGEVRASALRGLMSAPDQVAVADRLLEDALTHGTPQERYWACLFVSNRKHREFIEAIRRLAANGTTIGSTWYFGDTEWPHFKSAVGNTVADAAKFALSVLSPASGIWRQNSDWQRIVSPENPAAHR